MKKKILLKLLIIVTLVLTLISACSNSPMTAPAADTQSIKETETQIPATAVPVQTETPEETAAPEAVETEPSSSWRNLPIVPEVSPAMVEVFQRGLADGREPNR